jgi:hypothetical protein
MLSKDVGLDTVATPQLLPPLFVHLMGVLPPTLDPVILQLVALMQSMSLTPANGDEF